MEQLCVNKLDLHDFKGALVATEDLTVPDSIDCHAWLVSNTHKYMFECVT